MKVPKLRRTTRVCMPRFRVDDAEVPMSLTGVVHRILARALKNASPFGVFVMKGRAVLCNVESARFHALARRSPDALIATYNGCVKVEDVLDDLQGSFSDD